MIKRYGACLLAVAAVTLSDQWFKHWITANVKGTAGIELPAGLVRLTYVENRGAAFGILENMRWLFVILGAAVVIAICFTVVRERVKNPFALAGTSLITAGTIGNLIDRAANGFVVDMFELTFVSFAIFNIADIALTLGGVTICLYILLHRSK